MDLRTPRELWRAGRFLPLLLTPALLAVSTFPGKYRVPIVYWVLALAACALFAWCDRWPLPISLAISALALPMFVIPAWGPSGLVPYVGAAALVVVVMRGDRRATVFATAVWAVAVVAGQWGGHEPSMWRGATVVQAVAYVGLPLLLGLYLRGQRELTASLRLRAADAENRTRAEERTALARELHDMVAHHMASIVLRVKVARTVLADPDPRVREVLDDVAATAAGALADIRRLLAALRDPMLGEVALLDTGSVREEIEAAVSRVRQAGFTVEAHIGEIPAGLDAIGRLTLLRLVQESLTNAMKHADRGEPVHITVAGSTGGIDLEVRNACTDQPALTTHPAHATSPAGQALLTGQGIIGMRERAELASGTVDVVPLPQGWRLQAWLPVVAR
ncbi:sensor histidine kinase [Nocardia sp. NPDC088792]|uniref:sensor histidine kinase n=1 Tax=Nocardia sp. NPDC088792 TaxID=3364332 RepID=UPI00380077A5